MKAKNLLAVVTILGITFSLSGCTVGMFGDQGASETHVQLTSDAKPAISPDSVKVYDIEIKGVTVSQHTIDAFVKKNLEDAQKIADITAAGSGYGDTKEKAIERAKRRAASVGANIILVTGSREELKQGLMAIEGAGGTLIDVIAYYKG